MRRRRAMRRSPAKGDQKKEKTMMVRCERRLLKFEELPEYMKDNEYILDHYRCEWSLRHTFLSIFSLHNETLNIWSHLGGFLIFVAMAVVSSKETSELGLAGITSAFSRSKIRLPSMLTARDVYLTTTIAATNGTLLHGSNPNQIPESLFFNFHREGSLEAIPKWPWFVFLAGAMTCLIFSSLSHLFACHSKRFNLFFWRLDYAGISLMIVCSFFAPIYYAFSRHPYWRVLYLSCISILGVLAITTLLAPSLSAPRFRSFRAVLFLAMGFSGVIPATHVLYLHWVHPNVFVALGYELAMAVAYASGAVFYVARVPERWKPGTFDIAGHSHQIFHAFVVLGALAHSAATLLIMDFQRASPSCAF
ncbi:PREDICTED: heptahelical transmembrane protein 2-like [Tarenaya hassleriana]|uniref:heptahelical transmembrane protein 2-like n=1 Tax=Tarenaya hassleriana TaxID=28532 RepID=UPI00053C5DC5|nr:PREDICTED: heptahelical transmembrane protein 2-like [Tarenaya hassleriana]